VPTTLQDRVNEGRSVITTNAAGAAQDDGFLPDSLSQIPVPDADPSFVSYLMIRQAMNALARLQERYVVDQPASELQAYVCSVLRRVGRPLRMGDIARFLCVEPQTVTGLVKRMELKGLVRRVQSTEDRREVLLEVTDEGRERARQALMLTQTVRKKAFGSLSLDQHVALAAVMMQIRDLALDALGDDPTPTNDILWSVYTPDQLEPFFTARGGPMPDQHSAKMKFQA
jgi:DNA-binding MarR family transcriptional regulator